ncbi:MAG: TetR/AcrR family transcriptional regulator [Desulfamplus sp.]|nr:TetR/AcrR family transcriptional regulator [Desulfamplus sp.]
MKYMEFKKILDSLDSEIYREVFQENQDNIRIKKEKTAVKNFEKIFDAVFQITYEKGFQAMTMRDLSSRTNMSLGSLYAYFASKEELLSIIHRQGGSMIKNVFAKFHNPDDPPLEQLRSVIKVHIFLSEASRPWFYFTFMEAKNLDTEGRAAVLSMEEHTENMLVHILETGEQQGVFLKRNHLLTASIIKAMQQEWYLKRWKYKKRKISVDDYADYVLEFTESFCLNAEQVKYNFPDNSIGQ